jgi:hypothetical protein
LSLLTTDGDSDRQQGWRTVLRNQAPDIAAIDLFVVLTIGDKLLHGLAIIHLERRCLI